MEIYKLESTLEQYRSVSKSILNYINMDYMLNTAGIVQVFVKKLFSNQSLHFFYSGPKPLFWRSNLSKLVFVCCFVFCKQSHAGLRALLYLREWVQWWCQNSQFCLTVVVVLKPDETALPLISCSNRKWKEEQLSSQAMKWSYLFTYKIQYVGCKCSKICYPTHAAHW